MIHWLKSCLSVSEILLVLVIFQPLPSSAQVHYTDIIPDAEIELFVPWPTQCNSDQYGLDINLDNTVDFILHAKCDGGYYPDTAIISIQSSDSSGYFVIDESGFIDTLNYYGDTIAPWLNWVTGEKALLKTQLNTSIYFGNWIQEKEHFVGIKVQKGASTYFGWIRMVVTNGGKKATVNDFGMDSVPDMPVMAGQGLENFALNIQVADVGDQKNAEDILVNFDPAYNEMSMAEYRIMVVNDDHAEEFTLDSANAVTEDHYSSVPAEDTSHSVRLDPASTDTDGQLITNLIGYSVFILSYYENTSNNVLSYPVPIVLRTQAKAVTDVFCRDNGNAGDGRDVLVTFPKVSNEDSISEYRVMVVPAQQEEMFDLETADQVGQEHYTALVPVDTNIVIPLDSQSTDINGDPIMEENSYYVFVLSVADGLLADKNALSNPSNLFILSTPSYLYAGQMDKPCIHYVDFEPDIELTSWEQTSYTMDLNGDGTEDYDFYCYWDGMAGFGAYGSSIEGFHPNKKIITSGNSTWIKKFNFGDPLTFFDEMEPGSCILRRYTYTDQGPNVFSGYWGGARDKYAGLILFDGNDTIMGWVKMNVYATDHICIQEYAWTVYSHNTTAAFTYEITDVYGVQFTNLSEGESKVQWDFGDGMSSWEVNPTHLYTLEKDYQVVLKAYGLSETEIASEVIHICEMPTASFTYELSPWGHLVLTDQSIKAKTWLWDFGDGSSSTESSPEHYYQEDGNYPVTLIVARGECTDTATTVVNVCLFPKADFYYEIYGIEIFFYNTSLRADSLAWDFRDGSGSSLANPVHSFSVTGEYNVVLHVYNDCGQDSVTHMVYVGLEDMDKDVPVSIYPVPASDQVYILPEFYYSEMTATFYDPSGNIMLSIHKEYNGVKTIILDLESIAEGIYFLQMMFDDRVYMQKMIVIR
ncbi:MAG TPA: PKD domain-containing protein [Bacteroidales bacterium]|nr:PKD domain-containing protein [Bacteroidales bacterium]HNS46427.1 PKD domain-containing protein [Bacteroidales bacterium]